MKIKKRILIIISFVILIFTASIIIFQNSSIPDQIKYRDVHYTEDYSKLYGRILKTMFGEDYKISEPTESSMTVPVAGEHEHTIYFTDWNISYTDGNGDTKTFYMSNRSPLEYWIKQHANEQAVLYYQPLFDEEFKDIPLAQSSALYSNIARIACNRDDVPKMCRKTDRYLERLSTPKGCIHFCEMTDENVFELMPTYLDVHVFIANENLTESENIDIRKSAEEAAERFTEKINKLTGHSVNFAMIVGDSIGDVTDTRKYYIQGNEIASEAHYFERYVFNACEEKFF